MWCVRHKTGWCATERNRKPSRDAVKDKTACGQYVMFRIGSMKGEPSCLECCAVVDRRKARGVVPAGVKEGVT